MAHFIADIQGSKGPTSRLGTKQSGIAATITGWSIGCNVSIHYDETLDEDVITITRTGGSNHSGTQGETIRWVRPVDHARGTDNPCPTDANHYWTETSAANITLCQVHIKIRKNALGCTRPKDHEGLHHNHEYNGTCKKTWTTEEAVIEAL